MYSRSYGNNFTQKEIRDNFSGRIPPEYKGELLRSDALDAVEETGLPCAAEKPSENKKKLLEAGPLGSLLQKQIELEDIVLFGVMLLLLTSDRTDQDVLILLAILFLISL